MSRRNRRCGVSNNVNGCDGEAPNFFSMSRQFVLVSYVDLCVLECLGDLRVCV